MIHSCIHAGSSFVSQPTCCPGFILYIISNLMHRFVWNSYTYILQFNMLICWFIKVFNEKNTIKYWFRIRRPCGLALYIFIHIWLYFVIFPNSQCWSPIVRSLLMSAQINKFSLKTINKCVEILSHYSCDFNVTLGITKRIKNKFRYYKSGKYGTVLVEIRWVLDQGYHLQLSRDLNEFQINYDLHVFFSLYHYFSATHNLTPSMNQ